MAWIGVRGEGVGFEDAWIGTQAHCPAVVEIFVAPYHRIALVVKPFPHQVNDRMWSVFVKLHTVRLFKPRNVAGELNRRKLHPKADAQKRDSVLARIPDRFDLALDSPLAEAPRHQNPVGAFEQSLPTIFFHVLRIHVIKLELHAVSCSPVHERFIEALVGFLEVDVFADNRNSHIEQRILDRAYHLLPIVENRRPRPDIEKPHDLFIQEGLDEKIVRLLNIWTRAPVLDDWEKVVGAIKNPLFNVRITIVGKYIDLKESYKSLNEALVHGAAAHGVKLQLDYVDSENVEKDGGEALLEGADGVLVPGGFGQRGVEGKIKAIRYARENRIPFLGICLGMQLATVEFARNVAGLEKAHSMEFDKHTPHPVIYLMREWFDHKSNTMIRRNEDFDYGGTMRLGAYPCVLEPDTFAANAYQATEISERHRHRYEFNNEYREVLARHGMLFTGLSPDKNLVEVIELPEHPWFLGCQFHPEFKSRPRAPHPLFKAFTGKALEESRRKNPESFAKSC